MKAVTIQAIEKVTINDVLKALKSKGYRQKDIEIIKEVLIESQIK